MLIDVSHCGDKTALDTIQSSKKPIIISHCGSRTPTPTTRMLPDDVLQECAEGGGVLGVEMAGAIISTEKNPVASLEAYMEQIEYCIEALGIDHVGFGPDTLYGDHIGLYQAGAVKNKSLGMGYVQRPDEEGDEFLGISMNLDALPEYVKGMENPNESIQNPIRWMIKNGYSDDEISKIRIEHVVSDSYSRAQEPHSSLDRRPAAGEPGHDPSQIVNPCRGFSQ